MGHLEDVRKALYGKEKKDEETIQKRLSWRMFFPRPRRSIPVTWVGQEHAPQASGGRKRKLLAPLFVTLLTVIILVSIGLFVFLYIGYRGQEAQISIRASTRTESGALVTIPIVVRNVSREILTEGEVVLTLPSGSMVREEGRDKPAPGRLVRRVADLKPDQTDVIEFEVRFFGSEGDEPMVEAAYVYRPGGVRAKFTARADHAVRIVSVPLALSWDFPETLTRGQNVEITVRYVLQSKSPFHDVAFRIQYPPGFIFESADPPPAVDETLWMIGTLQPQREGSLVIRGSISGEEGEVAAFRGALGIYNAVTQEWNSYTESSRELKIAVSPLMIEGVLDGARSKVVTPGDHLNFEVRYRNNTPAALKNVTIRAYIEGQVVNRSTLQPDRTGVVEFGTGAVVWGPGSAAELRDIAPGQGGKFGFGARSRTPPPMRGEEDKKQIVRLRVEIDVATIPGQLQGTKLHAEDLIEFKVRSETSFAAKALYNSPLIPNSGPVPPRPGEKTTYTIHWEIRNYTNDLADAQVVSRLATNVAWEQAVQTQGSPISYDSASGIVRWHIGNIPAGMGVLTPALIGAFQVSIIPSDIDAAGTIVLTQESEFTAKDTFVNEEIKRRVEGLTAPIRVEL